MDKTIHKRYELSNYIWDSEQEQALAKEDLKQIKRLGYRNRLNKEIAFDLYQDINRQRITFSSQLGKDFYADILHVLAHEPEALHDGARFTRFFLRVNKHIVLFVLTFIVVICCTVFGYNAYMDYRSAKQLHALSSMLAKQEAQSSEEQTLPLTSEQSDLPKQILPQFQDFAQKNPDFTGWLSIGDTVINYPVMHTSENDFYLSHNFDKEADKNGLLVLDYRCDIENESSHYLIYGHNMNSGLMFGSLSKYKDPEYRTTHPVVHFSTLYEEADYEIFCVFLSEVAYQDEDVFKYYNFISSDTKEEFDQYLANIKSLELYDTGIPVSYPDKLLILSTCDNSKKDGRLVVVARKI